MLDLIPNEVFSQIAYHLALTTLSPPIPLLRTCKRIHDALTPDSNPELYARVYRATFDCDAAIRRASVASGSASGPVTKQKGKDPKGKGKGAKGQEVDADANVTALSLTNELERRVRVLRRLRRRVRGNDVREMRAEEAWVVYMMLIENDGKNVQHLTFLPELVDLFHAQILHPWSFTRGYPPESTLSSLMLWIDWIYSHHPRPPILSSPLSVGSDPSSSAAYRTSLSPEEIQLASERERQRAYERDYPAEAASMRRTALRPYVFAAHKYSVYFAPWMATRVPLRHPLAGAATIEPAALMMLHRMGHGNAHPHPQEAAAFRAADRTVEVQWYGRSVRLSPPLLAHAALMKFFDQRRGRIGGMYDSDDESDEDDDDLDDEDDIRDDETHEGAEGEVAREATAAVECDDDDPASPTTNARAKPPKAHPILQSASHDTDFRRLLLCSDPHSSPGLPRGSWRGVFSGAWEGTFSFFEFDAYGEMLAGHAGAIYSGPYGVQRQVWKLRETFVRRKVRMEEESEGGERGKKAGKGKEKEEAEGDVRGKGKDRATAGCETAAEVDSGGDMATAGPSEEAEAPETAEADSKDTADIDEADTKFPLQGPSTNAGFPLGPSTVRGGLASARAEETALQETIKQQVEAMGDEYEAIPEDELSDMEALSNDEAEEAGIEMLLTGTGHSAWGRFLLKGRVRYWDGLATLVKEYAPDSRGKWLYRGYVVAGGSMVGRWRDTYTADQFVGYEGTFILNRR